MWDDQKSHIDKLKPSNPGKGDPGYDKETHFNTSIAKSYFALEEAVRSTRPHLRHRHSRTIREFVNEVSKDFPEIKEKFDKYIDMYELARFGNHRCTKVEFMEFFKLLKEIVSVLRGTEEHL